MARWKTARGNRKTKKGPGGLIGCVVVVALMIAFVTWTFFVFASQLTQPERAARRPAGLLLFALFYVAPIAWLIGIDALAQMESGLGHHGWLIVAAAVGALWCGTRLLDAARAFGLSHRHVVVRASNEEEASR